MTELKPLYYCTRCKSIVRETDDYGEFVAGKCRCDSAPSPWVPVDLHWEGLGEKFRPGGSALPKSITLLRGLVPGAKTVSPEIVETLLLYLDAAYERLNHRPGDEALARKVLEAAAGCQPSTAEDPNEDAYQRGRFDAVMEFCRAILALNPAEILETK